MSGEPAPPPALPPADLTSRINFLFKVIEDTQGTVRFLDTKAAFCVTLLSGMAAVSLQPRPEGHPLLHRVLFLVFLTVVVGALLVCLRVIFPTIKPHIHSGAPAKPQFYVGHNKAHHWILHTLRSPDDNILTESRPTYMHSLEHATDERLLSSLCDAVLILAYIRQVKSDRLHAAMFCLVASLFLFAAVMVLG
jgi:hypothetical protein